MVAGAYSQSNWCRQITGAARKLGLEVALVLLHGEKGPALQGNLLLDRLMGADVTVVDLDSMERLTPVLEAKAAELERAGRRPYLVRPFGLDKLVLGAVGYVNGALELDAQLEASGHRARFPLPLRRQHDARGHGARAEGARPPDQADQFRADRLERADARSTSRASRRPPPRAWTWTCRSRPRTSTITTTTSGSATAW